MHSTRRVKMRRCVLRKVVLRRTLNFFAACGAKNVCGEHHFCEIEALNKAVGSHAATLANHANQRPPFSSRFEHFRKISASFYLILGPDLRQLTCLNTCPQNGCWSVSTPGQKRCWSVSNTSPKVVLVRLSQHRLNVEPTALLGLSCVGIFAEFRPYWRAATLHSSTAI